MRGNGSWCPGSDRQPGLVGKPVDARHVASTHQAPNIVVTGASNIILKSPINTSASMVIQV